MSNTFLTRVMSKTQTPQGLRPGVFVLTVCWSIYEKSVISPPLNLLLFPFAAAENQNAHDGEQ